jgi:hypothetical protein
LHSERYSLLQAAWKKMWTQAWWLVPVSSPIGWLWWTALVERQALVHA